jgi:tRNA-splicing endonuclease subunit Sen34
MECQNPATKQKIRVTLTSDIFLVWNSEEVSRLRNEQKIVGRLIGCNESTVPLVLSRFEMRMLIENQSVIIERCLREDEVSQEQLQMKKTKYEEEMAVKARDYREMILQGKEKMIRENSDELIRKRRVRSKEAVSETDEDIIEQTIQREREKEFLPPVVFDFESKYSFKQEVPIQYVESLLKPKSLLDELRCLVFENFWKKGLFITSGFKFACDFLVYEGDPQQCHSTFMVICREDNSLDELLTQNESVVLGRLSVSVNKQALYASFKNKNDPGEGVIFKRLNWEGKRTVDDSLKNMED